MADHKGTD